MVFAVWLVDDTIRAKRMYSNILAYDIRQRNVTYPDASETVILEGFNPSDNRQYFADYRNIRLSFLFTILDCIPLLSEVSHYIFPPDCWS